MYRYWLDLEPVALRDLANTITTFDAGSVAFPNFSGH
jgi:hypothetical protein